MLLNRKQQWLTFAIINGILLFVLLFFPFYWKYIMALPFNKCTMLEYLHIYCPACGGTRAFHAMLRLDVLSAFVYNPIVPIGFIGFIAYEIDMIKHLILKTDREVFSYETDRYFAEDRPVAGCRRGTGYRRPAGL